MAFMRYADVRLQHPRFSPNEWQNFRDQENVQRGGSPHRRLGGSVGRPRVATNGNLVHQASEIFGSTFKPDDYLLSHCTIVCSVDTMQAPENKMGQVEVDGQKIHRKWADYRIQPECDRFINNNLDAWERRALQASYPTFIGAQNFVEHIQDEAQSKGRIIDAVARNIGPSLYIDILVATERKHSSLVASIETGSLNTLSMGCSVLATTCTKCGNVAADETQLCNHVRLAKGNTFYDENGQMHRVAELCGHVTMDQTAGITFIEGSWVRSPAFQGAVMRNILTAAPDSALARRAEAILSRPPAEWLDDGHMKAAFDFDSPEDEGEAEKPAKPEKSPLDDAVENTRQEILDRALEKIRMDLQKKDEGPSEVSPGERATSAPDDNVMHQASQDLEIAQKNSAKLLRVAARSWRVAVAGLIRTANSDAEFLNKLAVLNESLGIRIRIPMYRAALNLGPIGAHSSREAYLKAAAGVLGAQSLTPTDTQVMLRLGEFLDQRQPR